MKTVVIIDDEPLARQVVREYLAAHPEFEVVAECDDGFEGAKAIMKLKPDLVFLDVQMPRISGLEMLDVIEDPPGVIFATAFDEFAIRAFERNAVDYLLKPFSKERFDQAIGKWMNQSGGKTALAQLMEDQVPAGSGRDRIVVRNQGEISIVPVSEVMYLEAFDDYVKIFTANSYYLKKRTMSHFEKLLDPGVFFRTHRSYIINLRHLARVEPFAKNSYVAVLRDGRRVPVSRSSYSRLKSVFGI